MRNRNRPVFWVVLACLGSTTLLGQPYIDGGNTRHRFAQLNLGTDNRLFMASGAEWVGRNAAGEQERHRLGAHGESRFIIGGTHFWGHADFYLATPIATFGGNGFSTGAESVFQFFPWRIQNRKLRPYAGFSWLTAYYKQGEGATFKRFRLPLLGGMVYNHEQHLFELGFGYNYAHRFRYYTSPTEITTIKTQRLWLSFAYKWMFETTLSNEKNWRNGRTRWLTDSLSTLHRLSGLTLAFGPSEAVLLKPAPHNEAVAPYIDQHKATKVFPDVAIGYYLQRPDMQANLVFRGYRNTIGAYGYKQTIQRRALSFEVFRFWLDYHGFAAFAGPALSQEWLKVTDTPATGPAQTASFRGLRPGLTFGWDIRPDRLQTYYLRTNLRYFPNLDVLMPSGQKVYFDALELNFIQLVVFPGRIWRKIPGR